MHCCRAPLWPAGCKTACTDCAVHLLHCLRDVKGCCVALLRDERVGSAWQWLGLALLRCEPVGAAQQWLGPAVYRVSCCCLDPCCDEHSLWAAL